MALRNYKGVILLFSIVGRTGSKSSSSGLIIFPMLVTVSFGFPISAANFAL
jgi:hypothetical protein